MKHTWIFAAFFMLWVTRHAGAQTNEPPPEPESPAPAAGGAEAPAFLGGPAESDASELPGEEADRDPRENVLLYGIETDVLAVIASLTEEGTADYNTLLTGILDETKSPKIGRAVYRLWDETDYIEGLTAARAELTKVLEDFDYSADVVKAAMAYLAGRKDTESVDALVRIAGSLDISMAAAAVRAVGRIGSAGEENAEALLERFREADPVSEEDLVSALIVTLGQLAYAPAADDLVPAAEDSLWSLGHRRLACVSVGRIGRDEDYPVIERIFFESEDATLRAYALAGLAEFPRGDPTDVLVQALKRDSFWRIRVTAAEKLAGNNSENVVRLLEYKAENDPVKQVRAAAMRSLGAASNPGARRFLHGYVRNETESPENRLGALKVLIENRIPGTADTVKALMDQLWEKDEGRLLEFTALELSRAEWNELAPLYERMLDHPNWLLQVYAVRGIRRSGIERLAPKIDAMNTEGVHGQLKREIEKGN